MQDGIADRSRDFRSRPVPLRLSARLRAQAWPSVTIGINQLAGVPLVPISPKRTTSCRDGLCKTCLDSAVCDIGGMSSSVLQEESPPGRFQFRLDRRSVSPDISTTSGGRTFHTHWYSSSFGGATVFADGSGGTTSMSSCSCASSVGACAGVADVDFVSGSSKTSNSRSLGASPRFFTAGRPFFTQRSLSVNRGPISCKDTFSRERKAYLQSD